MFSSRKVPVVVTYDFSRRQHKIYSVHLNIAEMFNWMEKVNFTGMIGLINPKDPSFFNKLKQAKNIVSLKLIYWETEEWSPATKCLFTDFLFETDSCQSKKFNLNMLVPSGKPERFMQGECLTQTSFPSKVTRN